MEYKVEHREIDINLKLTEKEFNLLVANYGASNYNEAKKLATRFGLEIISSNESDKLYTALKELALKLKI